MKKILLSVICLFFINCTGFCMDNISAQIQQLEKTYFGYDYPNEGSNTRLDRLEKAVYGSTTKKSAKERVYRLKKDLQDGLAFAPYQENQYSSQNTHPSQTSYTPEEQEELPPADKSVRYPVVDKIEKEVFKKSYPDEDIYRRLSRLEKQVYKKESKASLNERVDSLRASVLANARIQDDNSIIIDGYDPGMTGAATDLGEDLSDSQYNYYTPGNTRNRIAKPSPSLGYDMGSSQSYDIDMLEKSVFGNKFTGESASRRLARLENSVFSRTFNDDDDARVQRLLAATTAQKTAKHYDNNRLMQNLNTGIQIGGIILMVLAMIL